MGGLVWLASYPKSGNTWVRAFIHNLLGAAEDGADINKLDALTITDNAPFWYEAFLDGKKITECQEVEIAELRPKVHRLISEQEPGFVFLKTHAALVHHLGAATVTPELTAGAVYIVRNPLDIAVSYSHFMGLDVDATIALMNTAGRTTPTHPRGVYQLVGSWSEHVRSWTHRPNPSLHILRYEDMIEEPEQSFAALAQFLMIARASEELARAIELSRFERLRAQELAAGFKEKPDSAEIFFREGRAGQWRDVLTGAQIAAIVAENRAEMARFGYLPDGF